MTAININKFLIDFPKSKARGFKSFGFRESFSESRLMPLHSLPYPLILILNFLNVILINF